MAYLAGGVCSGVLQAQSSQRIKLNGWVRRIRSYGRRASQPINQTLLLVLGLALMALSATAQNTINTIAGGGPNNLPATSSSIGYPWGVVQDAAGNTYVSDNLSYRVFKVDTSSNLTVFAGNTVSGNTGDGGPASSATMGYPGGIAVDSSGNIYIADAENSSIRVVNTQSAPITVANVGPIPPGAIATVAGTGTPCPTPTSACGDGGAATSAQLNAPGGVAVDANGNIFIADSGDNKIRKVLNSTGIISTVAGTGNTCSAAPCGDGAAALSAQLTSPYGVYVDGSDDLYIADSGDSAIRVVNLSGSTGTFFGVSVANLNIGTVAGTLRTTCTTQPCGDGSLATSAQLNNPYAVVLDSNSNLLIADSGDMVVRQVSASTFKIVAVAGNYSKGFSGDNGPATSAQLNLPTGLFVDASDDIYIADQNNSAVRKVTAGNISTVVGIGLDLADSGDGGSALKAELREPFGVGADTSGNAIVADTANSVIRKVDSASGHISTIAGTGESICRTASGSCGDGGPAASALLSYPTGMFVDASGNIFIADYQPGTGPFPLAVIREIVAASGNIETVAGNYALGPGFSGDTGPATLAQLGGLTPNGLLLPPLGVFVDQAGIVYISDALNNRVRVVNTGANKITVAGVTILSGDIDTIAGDGTACSTPTSACGDGGPATSANLTNPSAVAVDNSGNIYIADAGDNKVRVVSNASGIIQTLAGTGSACPPKTTCGDGGPATSATLTNPVGVLADYAGNVFIADLGDNVVREVTVSNGNIATVAGNYIRGFSGDGGAATSAALATPEGLGGDPSGNLLLADSSAWRVRKVAGLVATAPTAVVSPTTLTFASQAIGTTSNAQQVTVTNTANLSSLTVTSVTISGANAGDFAQTNNCTTVPPNTSCTINVTFTPSATGTRSATLTISDDAGTGQQTVALSGSGVTSPPNAVLSPTGLKFASQVAGTTSKAQTITITNTATLTALTVTNVAISGANAGDFAQTNNCTTVQPNASCTINVTFTPSAAGTRSATLTVSDNAVPGQQTAALSGDGTSATFTLPATGTLSPSSVSAGGSAKATITIDSVGSFNGTVQLTCTVSPSPSLAPGCALNPVSVTPPGSTSSTLTVTTTAAVASLTPAAKHRSGTFYAMWLMLPAMLLSTAGLTTPRRRKLLSCLLIALAIVGMLFLAGCGGSSSHSNGGGGGTPGTPSGQYTITVKATSGSIVQTQTFNLTVQ